MEKKYIIEIIDTLKEKPTLVYPIEVDQEELDRIKNCFENKLEVEFQCDIFTVNIPACKHKNTRVTFKPVD